MRLIDADALCEGRVSNDMLFVAATCVPTIDAALIRHGYWITRRYVTDDDWGVINHREEVCSECQKWERERSLFCPNCGAVMDKARKDEDG